MAYIYNLSDTWNAVGTSFNGIKMAITNTASSATSYMLNLTTTGATTGTFTVDKNANIVTTGALTLGSALTVANGGTGANAYTAGQILYGNGTGALSASSNFFWDFTNIRLGIGTSSPASKVTVLYTSTAPSLTDASGAGLNLLGNSSVRMAFGTNSASPYDAWVQATNYSSNSFPISLNPLGGNVLINTEVNANAAFRFQISDGTITYVNGYLTGGIAYQGTYTNHGMGFLTNNSTRMILDSAGILNVCSAVATPAGGAATARLVFGTTAGFGVYYGSGAPTVSAAQGSLYLRSDGTTTNDRAYINTNGSTTWTALTTAA